MKKPYVLAIICFLFLAEGGAVFAAPSDQRTIADYLGINPDLVFIECNHKTYSITEDYTLKICLNKEDQEKRCEISIKTFSKPPAINDISFSFRLSGDALEEKYHYSLLQIHSFPDQKLGEKWRCPPFTMDMTGNHLAIQSRWDAQKRSQTSGYNCTEPGSSIQSSTFLTQENIKTGTWYPFAMSARLSYASDGFMKLNAFNHEQKYFGPNAYNDERPPYLKLGIYKPTSWTGAQKSICMEYKDIKMNWHK